MGDLKMGKTMKTMRKASAAALIILVFGFSGCERIKEAREKVRNRGQTVQPNQAAAQSGAQGEAAQGDYTVQNAKGPQAPGTQVFAVNTTLAVNGQIRDYLALSGDIIASSTVDTFSDAAGKISRIYVSVGSRVRRGDPVAEVDPSRPGMEFVASVVKAPVAGTIVALPAQLGMTVSQAVPLARIAGGAGLEIRLFVAERFISKIRLNQPCEITLDAYPGDVFRGSVTEISPTVDTVSRTMEIRVGVENPGSRLKAGMFAKVRVITEAKENIVKIPAGAMVNRFGEQYVFSIEKTDPAAPVARKKPVVPGIIIDGVMEIRQGLLPDEEIVIRGQTLIDDGSRINIIEQLAPLSAD
jgi:multidrug efflux pump subunit AcrA (membrane-fusion protein)